MNLEQNKDKILRLLQSVARPGIDLLCEFLECSDFFTAPASTVHHLAIAGGLASHSYNVYRRLLDNIEKCTELIIPTESASIVAICHDLCKVNYYSTKGEPCSDSQYQYLSQLIYKARTKDISTLIEDKKLKRDISKEHASILINWLKSGDVAVFPELKVSYTVKDTLPLGHGEKSLSIVQDYIQVTKDEKLAIRWHMGAYEPGIHFYYPTGQSYRDASNICPLLHLLQLADLEATNILEAGL